MSGTTTTFAPPSGNRSAYALSQASGALRDGDRLFAEQILRAHLLLEPKDAEARFRLAEIQADGARFVEAIMSLGQLLKLYPDLESARIALARTLMRDGRPGEALAEFEHLPKQTRDDPDLMAFEAALCGLLGLHQRELALYEKVIAIAPRHPEILKSYGDALRTVGRSADAEVAVRKAIRIRPNYGEAWWTLANFKNVRFTAKDLAAMRRASRASLQPADAAQINFALGKALEDRQEYADSFAHYETGNRLRAAELAPGEGSVTAVVDTLIRRFDSDLFARLGNNGSPSREPIFVIGLQRSGSTLIEQILASHPEIEGTAELTVIPQLWEELRGLDAERNPYAALEAASAKQLADLGDRYLEKARMHRVTDRSYFVDKLPANWLHIGFIRLILPNARIVDARRHPMACGFSNFKQFYASGVTFAYSQETIGRFYADYLRWMEHVDRVQPGAVHHAFNERLIDDPVTVTRGLLDFVGVEWNDACLEFYKTERAVRTPSAEQVRRKLNRDGVDAWRNFEPWLRPMAESLGDALSDWDKVR